MLQDLDVTPVPLPTQVSNHVASIDDPLVTAALVPPRHALAGITGGSGLQNAREATPPLGDAASSPQPPQALAYGGAGSMRWTLCATDRCFASGWMAAFFRAGKVCRARGGNHLS